jgi:hypothetical protein
MVLIFAVVAGVVIGMVTGGRLARLAALPFRFGWLALLAVAVQVALIYAPPTRAAAGGGIDPLRIALPASLVALGVVVGANRRLPGMPLIALGLLANGAVIVANGGLMPTSAAALTEAGITQRVPLDQTPVGERLPHTKDVLLSPEQTRLVWLSDTIVSPPIPRRKVFSPGDLIVAAGVVLLLVRVMRRPALGDTREVGEYIEESREERTGAAQWRSPIAPTA